MKRSIIILAAGVALALLAAQAAHARGFGGCHGSYSGSGSHGSYSGSHSYSGGSEGRYGDASGSYNHSYEGSHGGSVDVSGTRGAATGPGGAAAGGTRDVSATGPNGKTYSSQSEHGAAAGPNGAVAGGSRSTTATGSEGTYHGTASYGAARTSLPTDAGYGAAGVSTGTGAYAGYHQTVPVSGGVYAAQGAAVRTGYGGYGAYGTGWYAAHPSAWTPTGWAAGQAWGAATWPAVGTSLGWSGGVQPVYYNYGTNVTYQDGQVYYGGQPAATADQYYEQAATLAQSAPAPNPQSGDWTPLGVFALVQHEQSDPHYVIQLAVNKAGVIGGNYTDMVSDTTTPVHGAVDQKTQRVAWQVGNNKNTVGETGLYNLTRDEAPALIHMGKDRTQQWLLVRLKQPQQQ
jgi:hypothetical protein